MKEVINLLGPKATIVESPIPTPNEDQVLIKVIVSGSNPKDWKVPEFAVSMLHKFKVLEKAANGLNQGDDIAGIVEQVGSNVTEFKPGDRVAAFHEMLAPGGSYAEYALAWGHTTFHLPKHISFEEAATLPLAALTAVVALYGHHKLPPPWTPAEAPIPLIIYGASAAVGSFAIKLARNSNIHPIIAVAGKGAHYVETLIDRSKGDTIVDYRHGVEETIQGIKQGLQASGQEKARYALDAAIVPQSVEVLRRSVAPGGYINMVLPNDDDTSPVNKTITNVGSVHGHEGFAELKLLGYVFSRYFTRALQLGELSGHPYQVRPGGLEGVEAALKDLKAGKASAVKYVFRIADTPGVASP